MIVQRVRRGVVIEPALHSLGPVLGVIGGSVSVVPHPTIPPGGFAPSRSAHGLPGARLSRFAPRKHLPLGFRSSQGAAEK